MSPISSVNVATVSKADPSEGRAHPMTSVKVKGGPRLSAARSEAAQKKQGTILGFFQLSDLASGREMKLDVIKF